MFGIVEHFSWSDVSVFAVFILNFNFINKLIRFSEQKEHESRGKSLPKIVSEKVSIPQQILEI